MQPAYSSPSSLREQLLHWRPKKVHKNNMQRLQLVWQWIIHSSQNTAVSQARWCISYQRPFSEKPWNASLCHVRESLLMGFFFFFLHYSELSGSQEVGTIFLIPSRGRAAVVMTDNSQSCLSQYVITNMNTKVVYRKQTNINTYRGWVRNVSVWSVPTILQNETKVIFPLNWMVFSQTHTCTVHKSGTQYP